jgi:hypothetical protein
MNALRKRRPSGALVVALIALFVALGGPAEAKRLFTGKDVKNRSLQTKDLTRKAVRELRRTPNGSVRERALAAGAVTTVKLAESAVTPSKIAPSSIGAAQLGLGAIGPRELRAGAAGAAQLADGAVSGAKVADGTLGAADIARFTGRFRITVPAVVRGTCWSGEPVGVIPNGVNISNDLVLVTPGEDWPEKQLAFTVRNSANASRFVLAGCNRTNADVPTFEVGFRYAVIGIP